MKNFKNIAFGLMVGALAIGFSAFTTANSTNHKKDQLQWFKLKSTVMRTETNAAIASNYDAPTNDPPCPGADVYCGVEADNVSGQPNLGSGTTARTQIHDFFNSGVQGAQISAQDQ